MESKRRNKKAPVLATVLSFVALLVVLIFQGDNISDYLDRAARSDFHYTKGTVAVHFIDVGQGSSTLIQSGNQGILIDAGERDYAQTVTDYIKTSGVKTLTYVVASHPHSDHIGAMADVLDAIPTENVIMPQLTESNTPTTSCYERLLKSIQKNKIKAYAAKFGKTYRIDHAQIELLGPLVQDDDLNNMSVVCKLTAFDTTFMLLADADKPELRTICNTNAQLKSDIILMGHHGSSKALYYSFLNRVNAKVAVVSCGLKNDYGHPHKETVKYIKDNHMEFYRTDLQSHIVFICDENGYQIQTAA